MAEREASGIVVRRSRPEDAAGLREALDSVARERRFLCMLEAPTVEHVAAYGARADVARMVALDDAAIVGWADLRRGQSEGFRHRAALGMGVVASHRRRGIGGRLLDAVIAEAPSLGVTRLELEVFGSNAAARALYAQRGFQVEGELRRARIVDGVEDDLILMVRWQPSA